MKRQRRNLNAYCKVKANSLRLLHTVWYQLYDILEGKIWDNINMSGCQKKGAGRRRNREHVKAFQQ